MLKKRLCKPQLLALASRSYKNDRPAEFRAPFTRCRCLRGIGFEIKLKASRHRHMLRTEAAQPLLILRALRQYCSEGSKSGPKHINGSFGLGARFFAFSRIGKNHGNVPPLRLAHNIGPNLGFHNDAHCRTRLPKKFFDCVRGIVGEITLMNSPRRKLHEFFACFSSCRRHMRQKNIAVRPILKHRSQKRPRGIGFAHRHGMNPYAWSIRASKRIGAPGEALIPKLSIGRLLA